MPPGDAAAFECRLLAQFFILNSLLANYSRDASIQVRVRLIFRGRNLPWVKLNVSFQHLVSPLSPFIKHLFPPERAYFKTQATPGAHFGLVCIFIGIKLSAKW